MPDLVLCVLRAPSQGSCPMAPVLLQGFRAFVLHSLDLADAQGQLLLQPPHRASGKAKLILISRKPVSGLPAIALELGLRSVAQLGAPTRYMSERVTWAGTGSNCQPCCM